MSGITFDVDMSKDAKVQLDDNKMFKGFGSDERRVSNIMINGKPIDMSAKYKTASIEYILLNQGNGYTMFTGEEVEMKEHLEDLDALASYLESMGGTMSEEYSDKSGQGRINIK